MVLMVVSSLKGLIKFMLLYDWNRADIVPIADHFGSQFSID